MPFNTTPSSTSLLLPNKTLYSIKRVNGTNQWGVNHAAFHGNTILNEAPTLEAINENVRKINKAQKKEAVVIKNPKVVIDRDTGYLTLNTNNATLYFTYSALDQMLMKARPASAREFMNWMDFFKSSPSHQQEYVDVINHALTDSWKGGNFSNRVIRTALTSTAKGSVRLAYGLTSMKQYQPFDAEHLVMSMALAHEMNVNHLTLTREDFEIRVSDPTSANMKALDALHMPVHGYAGRTNFITHGSTVLQQMVEKLICSNGLRAVVPGGMVACSHKTKPEEVLNRIAEMMARPHGNLQDQYLQATKIEVPEDKMELFVDDLMCNTPRVTKGMTDRVVRNLRHPTNYPKSTVARAADAITWTAHNSYGGSNRLLLEDTARNFIEDFATQEAVNEKIAVLAK
jgi:hypothetical protein